MALPDAIKLAPARWLRHCAGKRMRSTTRGEGMMKRLMLICGAAAALAISGCSGGGSPQLKLRKSLGIDKNPPDAYSVIARRPLTLPPSIKDPGELPPPNPNAVNRVDPDPAANVRAVLGTRQ